MSKIRKIDNTKAARLEQFERRINFFEMRQLFLLPCLAAFAEAMYDRILPYKQRWNTIMLTYTAVIQDISAVENSHPFDNQVQIAYRAWNSIHAKEIIENALDDDRQESRIKQRIRPEKPSLLKQQIRGEFRYWSGRSRRFKRRIAVERANASLRAIREGRFTLAELLKN